MARAAALPRLTWLPATISDVRRESATATTLRLDVDDWPGHVPGQHVDLRLTAPDGYSAVRPYSLASAGGSGTVEITVDTTPGGEVSTYLTQGARPGHHLEIRGPLGKWFVWDTSDTEPVQLIGGGSGIVPLMSMLRTHDAQQHPAQMRLLYSLPSAVHMLYRPELASLHAEGTVTFLYTRQPTAASTRPPGRITADDLRQHAINPDLKPSAFVCGPTGFVETVLTLLVGFGYDPERIRAERYGEGSST
ncbi:FAD-binding oxidoreductase [Nocardioides astragali]|uniref:FAD-binding oxidoreductase n=1 Tax=Nocardioides astragali TaxID=1776736 RepID=A0ABW2N8S6_9ACTN|nr:FAD-binding oxidoreductase [Nocardioides astragali]